MGLAGDAEPGVADGLRVDVVFEVTELLPTLDEFVVGIPFGAVGQVFGPDTPVRLQLLELEAESRADFRRAVACPPSAAASTARAMPRYAGSA